MTILIKKKNKINTLDLQRWAGERMSLQKGSGVQTRLPVREREYQWVGSTVGAEDAGAPLACSQPQTGFTAQSQSNQPE